jgi:hypothetical protein
MNKIAKIPISLAAVLEKYGFVLNTARSANGDLWGQIERDRRAIEFSTALNRIGFVDKGKKGFVINITKYKAKNPNLFELEEEE